MVFGTSVFHSVRFASFGFFQLLPSHVNQPKPAKTSRNQHSDFPGWIIQSRYFFLQDFDCCCLVEDLASMDAEHSTWH